MLSNPKTEFIFRPSRQCDLPQLIELLCGSFGMSPQSPFLAADLMRWKYWDARDDWTEPRSYVLEWRDVLVAHAGIWPAVIEHAGAQRRGIHLFDWAAAASAPGAGMTLLRHLVRMFDFTYAIGGAAMTQQLNGLMGFRKVAVSWRAARPIRPWRILLEPDSYSWRLPARLLRNLARAVRPPLPDTAASYEQTSLQQLPAILTSPAEIPRARGFFEFLSRCPGCRCLAYRILRNGIEHGFFVLMIVRHQARLSVWPAERGFEGYYLAYCLAQQSASAEQVLELAVNGSSPVAANAAVKAGFRVLRSEPVYLLDRAHVWGTDAPNIHFQVSDWDAIFFDEGGVLAFC